MSTICLLQDEELAPVTGGCFDIYVNGRQVAEAVGGEKTPLQNYQAAGLPVQMTENLSYC